MSRIVMLDFDGVINQFTSTTAIDPTLVRRVAKLVKETTHGSCSQVPGVSFTIYRISSVYCIVMD
jgi:hypothetical protein